MTKNLLQVERSKIKYKVRKTQGLFLEVPEFLEEDTKEDLQIPKSKIQNRILNKVQLKIPTGLNSQLQVKNTYVYRSLRTGQPTSDRKGITY